MERGRDFLRTQVSNAIVQHRALADDLEAHRKQAQDTRFRELCARYASRMEHHLGMLESYRDALGEKTGGGVKETLGSILERARGMAEGMRDGDFARLVSDTVGARHAQDTCALFAAVGDQLGEPRLAEIGRTGESEHDEMQRDFNQLARALFVEYVRGERGVVPEAAD